MRDLKVWFPLRRGLLRELTGGGALWVRAVDGLSFDVRRGEVYCLVGESGCGKTTTGKALLSLVEATEGDVFLEMPDDAYADFEQSRTRVKGSEDAAWAETLRRRYSITWKERTKWTRRDYLTAIALLVSAMYLAVGVAVIAVGLAGASFAKANAFLGSSILVGILLGGFSVLPPVRPDRKLSIVVALVAAGSLNLVPIVLGALSPYLMFALRSFDPLAMIAIAWGTDPFGLLVGLLLAMMLAGGISRTVLSMRQQSEGLRGLKMRTLRRRLHLIFQDPYESLNPKQSVFEIVEEPLKVNRVSSDPAEITALVRKSLEDAGLRPAEEFMFRFPHELSGGQRQRVSIAAALVLQPNFIVADEPVSMLDVSIRTEILQLMMQLRKERDLTYLFITHDLGLAWILADRVSVMYLGKIVESGTAEQVIAHPKHPYTQALISVVPSPDPRHVAKRTILKGERPDPSDIPTGCRFHPRCPLAFERCGWNGTEVAATLKESQQAIAARLSATISERRGQPGADVPSPQSAGDDPGRDAAKLEAARIAALALQDAVHVDGPRAVSVAPPSGTTVEDLADRLRSLVAAQRNERLALKGIREIRTEGGRVVLDLHEWTEPELIEVAPGNSVACHLVTAAPAPEERPEVPAEPAVAPA